MGPPKIRMMRWHPMSTTASASIGSSQQSILMVVSGYGKGQGEEAPGYEFDEFSQAYLIFKNNNLSIDVCSPKGGKVEADKFNEEKLFALKSPYERQIVGELMAVVIHSNLSTIVIHKEIDKPLQKWLQMF